MFTILLITALFMSVKSILKNADFFKECWAGRKEIIEFAKEERRRYKEYKGTNLNKTQRHI